MPIFLCFYGLLSVSEVCLLLFRVQVMPLNGEIRLCCHLIYADGVFCMAT